MAEPTFPERKYADLSYSDHSRYYKDHIRVFFKRGEQLWDSDMNNNLEYFADWQTRYTVYRRNYKTGQMPPYYAPDQVRYVIDPAYANDISGVTNCIYEYVLGMEAPNYWLPQAGTRCYVFADRMVISFTGSAWKSLVRLADYDRNMEIHIFVSMPKRGYFVSHIVNQPFRLFNGAGGSRCRGISPSGHIYLWKNGVEVGRFSLDSNGISRLQLYSTTLDFAQGDKIQLEWRSPDPATTLSRESEFAIVGQYL